MPTLLGQAYNTYFKRFLQFGHSGNNGNPTSTTSIQAGDGVNTSVSLSDDVFHVQPQNDDSNQAMLVKNQSGSNILSVDTSSSLVKAGVSQVNALTMYKDMGLFDFSPSAGVHNPMVANPMMFSDSGDDIAVDSSMFGTGTDPATTLDISSDGTPRIAIASYWYLDNNITIDSVRYMAMADGSATLNFHIMSYTMDNSTNFGDLSAGAVHANASVSAINSGVKTGTFSLDTANIDLDKVVIGFVENATDTSDVAVSFQIKYHIR